VAYCPECGGEMDAAAPACPRCGYDFPQPPEPPAPPGLAYSPLAEVALVVGIVAAGIGCLLAIVAAAVALVQGEWGRALIVSPLAFFLQLAMLVVFVRVRRIGPPGSRPR
jgi:hypothetical protein